MTNSPDNLPIISENFRVRTREVDPSGKLKLAAVADFFQEAAARHTECWGIGYFTLKQYNLFWILSRMRIDVYKYPKWGETVTLKTWAKPTKLLIGPRDFILSGADDTVLCKGSSLWFLLDSTNFKPQSVKRLPSPLQIPPEPEDVFDKPPAKVRQLKDVECSLSRMPSFSDIDVNNHLNNTHYIEWITDAAYHVMPEAEIKSLQINFLNEVKLHETITVQAGKTEPDQIIVQGLAKDNTPAFRAQLTMCI